MSLLLALAALTDSDQSTLEAYTRDTLHLSPVQEWWPYVAEALWEIRRRPRPMANPAAYVRAVAARIRTEAEGQCHSVQPVLDSHRHIIGHVYLAPLTYEDGTMSDEVMEAVSDSRPEPALESCPTNHTRMERAKLERAGTWVTTDGEDEARLHRLYLQGYSRRDAADILGWTILEVETVWARLYRKRSLQH